MLTDTVTQAENDKLFKVVAVGDGAVGKTSLLMKFESDTFSEDYVVFENYNAKATYKEKTINLKLWDTAGQEDFDRLRIMSYPDTDVFLVCFSLIQKRSFENVMDKWVPELRHYCPHTPIILVGTKLDLRSDKEVAKELKEQEMIMVSSDMGKKMKKKIKAISYVECSAKTGKNVPDVFNKCVKITLKARKAAAEPPQEKGGCIMM